MAYVQLPVRTINDLNSASDINQLQENCDYVLDYCNNLTTTCNNLTTTCNDLYNLCNEIRTEPVTASRIVAGTYINGNLLSSDYELKIGETAQYTFTSTTSRMLYISVPSGAMYVMKIATTNNMGTSGGGSNFVYLQPNNSTYTNAFRATYSGRNISQTNSNYVTVNSFVIGYNLGFFELSISTVVTAKQVSSQWTMYGDSVNLGATYICGAIWNDISTQWTSLGTLSFPQSTSGYILLTRIQ